MDIKNYLENKGFKLNKYPEGNFWEFVTTEDLLDDACLILQTTENFDRFVVSKNLYVFDVGRNEFISIIEETL